MAAKMRELSPFGERHPVILDTTSLMGFDSTGWKSFW